MTHCQSNKQLPFSDHLEIMLRAGSTKWSECHQRRDGCTSNRFAWKPSCATANRGTIPDPWGVANAGGTPSTRLHCCVSCRGNYKGALLGHYALHLESEPNHPSGASTLRSIAYETHPSARGHDETICEVPSLAPPLSTTRHQLTRISSSLAAITVLRGNGFHPVRLVDRIHALIATCSTCFFSSLYGVLSTASLNDRILRRSAISALKNRTRGALMTSFRNRWRMVNQIRARSTECGKRFFNNTQEFVPEAPVRVHRTPPVLEARSLV